MPASSGLRRLQAAHPFRHFPFTIVHGLEDHAIRSCGAPSSHLQCAGHAGAACLILVKLQMQSEPQCAVS